MSTQDDPCLLVGSVDHGTNLFVDEGRNLVRIVLLATVVASQENLGSRPSVLHRSQLVTHPELHHHPSGDGGRFLDVVGGSGSGVAEDELLGGSPTEQHRQLVDQLRAAHQVLVVGGQGKGVAE